MFSSIDNHGRYAFTNQPRIALWNLARLAETLLPLLAYEPDKAVQEAQAALAGFGHLFDRAFQGGMRKKLGLFTEQEGDAALATAKGGFFGYEKVGSSATKASSLDVEGA